MSLFVTVRKEDVVYRLNLDAISHIVEDETAQTVFVKMRIGREFSFASSDAKELLLFMDARHTALMRQLESEVDSC